MNVSLAAMQRSAAAFARPAEFDVGIGGAGDGGGLDEGNTGDGNSLQYITKAEGEMGKLCRGVLARSPAHTSFSTLKMFLALLLGLLVLASHLLLPKLVAWVQKKTGTGLYKRLAWIEGSAFQLQRMAAEGRGAGPWEGKEEDVPKLVEKGHLFSLTGENIWRGSDGSGGAGFENVNLETVMGAKGRASIEGREGDRVRLLSS